MARARLSYATATESSVELVGRRSRALDRALVAAGAPGIQPTYETLYGSRTDLLFKQAVAAAGLPKMDYASWPYDGGFVSGLRGELFREGSSAFYRLPDGVLAAVSVRNGWAAVSVAAGSDDAVNMGTALFQTLYPATFLNAADDRVPVTFWSLGPHGPIQRLRMLDASPWADISQNYPEQIRGDLEALMTDFQPGKGGQLLLWQGEPGTAKTWGIRALASEWLSWCEVHYITDPDSFFVESAAYMVDVLLAETYDVYTPAGEVAAELGEDERWRLLVLEDTGELLAANAKEKRGQGLSRLLNVTEGMLGQGLRVLVLVTTNDELGELNAAVLRPGRCASQVVFPRFTAEEASAWLGEEVAAPMTVAEMYARRGGAAAAVPEEDAPVSDEAVVSEVARVAAEHAPEGGYGETYWRAAELAVFWNAADWTTSEERDAAEAAFLAVEGVCYFESDAEARPDGDDWVQIWPEPGSDLAFERVLELARRPLS